MVLATVRNWPVETTTRTLFVGPTCPKCKVVEKKIEELGITNIKVLDAMSAEGMAERAFTETYLIQSVPYMVMQDGEVIKDLAEILRRLK